MRVVGCLTGAVMMVVLLVPAVARGAGCEREFRRGDTNQDANHDLSDGVRVLNWLFASGSVPGCLDAADANDDGSIDIADPVYSFQYLFAGGSSLPAPGTDDCGPDPTPDDLGCEAYVPCSDAGSCSSTDCCPPGWYCATPEGECESAGECREKPVACSRIFDPVCGCDGITYANDCEAAAAGVNVAHRGSCEPAACGDDGCPAGTYCAKADGDCDGEGECRERPDACPDVFDPVCGCDDVTYSNSCEAASAGVNIAHTGPCE